jgi:2-(1,2-epoxy-1,2-dihydrophenyl)acetyl-CoA isomerase
MSSILFEIKNNIAFITLNRPDKYNSFNKEMVMLLQDALKQCTEQDAIRAVCLTGNGKGFCAGQDLADATSDAFPGFTEVVTNYYNPIIQMMRNMPKPIVVGLNGVAVGAGANIALAGDIVVATASASFAQVFSKIGLVPDCGGTFILPRLIGMQRASALMMLGDKVSAQDALQMGMLYKVFDDEAFLQQLHALAEQVAQLPTYGLALTKQLLNESFSNNLTQQLQRECELQTMAGDSYDYKEGVNAFLEKRKPVFKGV